MRGATEAAIAFLICIPGGILMSAQTPTTHPILTVFADCSILIFYLLCYLAIVRFLIVPMSRLAWIVTLLSIASIAFFTFVHDSVIARMTTLGLSVAMLRLLTGITLLRYPVQRRLMRGFAAFMLLSSLIAFRNSYATALHGKAASFYPRGHVASEILLFAIVGFSLTGVFFLALFGDELTEIIGRRAQVDPLTGVLNRQGINVRFAAELDRATRNRLPLSILLIDIDFFKSINDTHGHLAGDKALGQVTLCILNEIRAYDLLGRFGGDEFMVLLPETSSIKAIEIAERIRSAPSKTSPMTLSIGVAEAILHERLATLVDRADAALYDAKRNGRNCIRTSR
jgi:diguanylate cyclase (GGDEF)-like protein